MDRQTLDMEGARTGEIFAASMKLGDYTITLANIATMALESHKFRPYDTPKNNRTRTFWATMSLFGLLLGLIFLAWNAAAPSVTALLLAIACLAAFAGGAGLAIRIILKAQQIVPYYALTIGVADTTKVRLVDDNREVLERIRDTVLMKIETGDRKTIGHFDLNTDSLNLTPNDGTPA